LVAQTANRTDRVRAATQALREGRLDEMLALIHPDVVCYPLNRPGLTMYEGHAGTLRMQEDARRVVGDFQMDYDEIIELADGRVFTSGRLVRSVDGTDGGGAPINAMYGLRDGLIISLESQSATGD